MPRVKLTEYRAKSLLVEDYDGFSICLDTVQDDVSKLDSDTAYVLKVDQGVKKRGKQGLIRLDVKKSTAGKAVQELAAHGYDQFIAEPMFAHSDDEERYLSIERIRGGWKVLYSPQGGVSVENNPESIEIYYDLDSTPLPGSFLQHIAAVMDRQHFSFIEINPLVVRDNVCYLLDAAVLADSAGESAGRLDWDETDIAGKREMTEPEQAIHEIDESSPASFSFRVLNPDGAVWLLLSGGGASITIADEAANHGQADLIGNYGEYSGGPTREETQVYTSRVLDQMFESSASKKALVIAGGVANFTDVRKTFGGVIDALDAKIDLLKAANIKVFVRRGGPNEREGLSMMEQYLREHDMLGSIHGSSDVLTTVIDEALEYINA